MAHHILKTFKIILLDTNETLCKAWTRELNELYAVLGKTCIKINQLPVEIIVHHGPLDSLSIHRHPEALSTIVAPGNSIGFLGGGFDLAIAKYFNRANWKFFESSFQTKLFNVTNGYSNRSHLVQLGIQEGEPWEKLKCDSILHLPTMKVPSKISKSHHDPNQFIFDLTWDMLTTLSLHNSKVDATQMVSTVIVPGLGTGYGSVSTSVCAKAMCHAIFIFALDPLTSLERSKLCLQYLGENEHVFFPGEKRLKYDHKVDKPSLLFKEYI